MRTAAKRRIRLACVLAVCLNVHAAEVIYIGKASARGDVWRQLERTARFYGLEARSVADAGPNLALDARGATVAVVIDAEAIGSLDQRRLASALRGRRRPIPVMIAGITEETNAAALRKWSAGAITGCRKAILDVAGGGYWLAGAGMLRQLAGARLPADPGAVRFLAVADDSAVQPLIAAGGPAGAGGLPVFAMNTIGGSELFFATAIAAKRSPVSADPYQQQAVFAAFAPYLIFLRYAAGERAWHTPGHYANLTIDDAWLREPYGHVNYNGLLREMRLHNFHTTVAFVPWNFDRSEPAVVSLFRAHVDRLSLCIHGNDHDHREFGPYDAKPLHRQEQAIRQGMARMIRFRELTGLACDPVMVFPHSIAPTATLAALKRYNLTATVNSLDVPLDATPPQDPMFPLMPATLAFANFASIRRYSAEGPIPEAQLAIDAFLGHPMLFYVHQEFFADGIDRFNNTADRVNRIESGTEWRSLGDIARRLYLERLRDDGGFDIRAYTGTITLTNRHARDATFVFEKEEDFSSGVKVLVDGAPHSYERAGPSLRLVLPVGAGESREIAITYENEFNLSAIDVSRRSLRITAIRYLSDFRDNTVSRSALGRRFVRSYSANAGRWNLGGVIGIASLAAAILFWVLLRGRSGLSVTLPHMYGK